MLERPMGRDRAQHPLAPAWARSQPTPAALEDHLLRYEDRTWGECRIERARKPPAQERPTSGGRKLACALRSSLAAHARHGEKGSVAEARQRGTPAPCGSQSAGLCREGRDDSERSHLSCRCERDFDGRRVPRGESRRCSRGI